MVRLMVVFVSGTTDCRRAPVIVTGFTDSEGLPGSTDFLMGDLCTTVLVDEILDTSSGEVGEVTLPAASAPDTSFP